jgi:hypothetical protein
VAFNTVFQSFLTTYLIEAGYKPPIRNTEELLVSGIKLACPPSYSVYFKENDETTLLKIIKNHVNLPSSNVTRNWVKYEKNISLLLMDKIFESNYASGDFIGENSEPLLCKLDDGVIHSYGQSMIMFHGDPLLRRVTEIIDRVVEAGLYNYWNSLRMHWLKLNTRKIGIVHPLNGYYSFNLYHMQPAFYLILTNWCLTALCFMVELMYKAYYAS